MVYLYGDGFIPLHRPTFESNERQYLMNCIESNFVSSVGAEIVDFDQLIAGFTSASYAVAPVNKTAALHVALELAGICRGVKVITQELTFNASCNADNARVKIRLY